MPSLSINSETIAATPGDTVFDHAEKLDVRVPTSCFKQGKCRECLVEVVEGMALLGPLEPEEEHLQDNFRLSCRAHVLEGDGEIRCHTLRRAAMRIEETATEALATSADVELDPAVLRDGDRVLLDGEEIACGAGPLHGIAVDLGTTTVVLRLIDLETGSLVATQSFENPQRFAGTDVMARIRYDSENKGRLQQRTLLGYMTHAIEAFPCSPSSIYEMVVAGNATMRDILFGLNVYTIGQRPYRSLTEHEMLEGKRASTSLAVTAKRLRLPMHPQARVYGLPLISGHVGADAAACVLAVELAREDRLVALMDIGTNTELIVGNRGRTLAASCPAGPAFEGGSISCGMPGLEGAIERVRLTDDGGVEHEVIGGKIPEGVCGSGLVELLGELVRTERMNCLGRFEDGSDAFSIDRERGISMAESDISELAQAKGANVAGLRIVLRTYGVDFSDVDVFYLAGGFARHLNVDAARRIGLIPNLPDEKIVQLGNASVEGATRALLSMRERRELESFVKTIEHVELETDPGFFDDFVEGCQFRPLP
jgi:uncharacterized 2Fe-2S/4Fe-4S cluster protein (DUF4445 family)